MFSRRRQGRQWLGFGLVLVVAALAGGCAKTTIEIKQKRAAESTGASQLRKVAVAPFNGPGGTNFAARLEAELAGITVDGRTFFQVTSASRRTRGTKTQRTGTASGVDVPAMTGLGRRLDVEGVYAGDVIGLGGDTKVFREQRRECVKRDEDDDGLFQKCERYREYTVRCEQRYGFAEIRVSVIDVAAGGVVYARKHTERLDTEGCEDEDPIRSESELVAGALHRVLKEITKDIAPYEETRQVVIKPAPTSEVPDGAEDTFDAAVEFLKAGDPERGCQRFEDLELNGVSDPNLSYNLAICDERGGDLRAALGRVQSAIAALGKPDEDYLAAELRYQELLDERRKLNDQLVEPTSAISTEGISSKRAGATRSLPDGQGDIETVQVLLNRLGYEAGPVDGVFGPKTAGAIRRFESDRGMSVTGKVSGPLLKALESDAGRRTE